MNNAGCNIRRVVVLLALVAAALAPSCSGASEPQITVGFEPATAHVGEAVRYRITIAHAPQERLDGVVVDDADGTFVVQEQRIERHDPGRSSVVVFFAAFELGAHIFPPVTASVTDTVTGRSERYVVEADDSLVVKALSDSTMKRLLPLKPVMDADLPVRMSVVGIMVLVAVLVLLGIVLYRRRFAVVPQDAVDQEKTIREALGRLEAALARGMAPERCYEEIGRLVRAILAARYPACDCGAATAEIRERCSEGGTVPPDAVSLLEMADMVKFAGSRPTDEECRHAVERVRRLLRSHEDRDSKEGQ